MKPGTSVRPVRSSTAASGCLASRSREPTSAMRPSDTITTSGAAPAAIVRMRPPTNAVLVISAGDVLVESHPLSVTQSGPHARAFLGVHLHQHLTLTVQRREHITTAVRDHELRDDREGSQPFADHLEELVDAFARSRRDHDRAVRPAELLHALGFGS